MMVLAITGSRQRAGTRGRSQERSRMDLQLAGKRAIVAGGSRGIGLAVARALVAEGSRVALLARDEAVLGAAARHLDADSAVTVVAADTTDTTAVNQAIGTVADRFGGVDILVNSAAYPGSMSSHRDLNELEDDDLRIEIETKVLGYLRTARAVAPHMKAQGWGRIINVSWLAARRSGNLLGSVRNASVAALTKNLADQLGPFGINVTVVHPGLTHTERTPQVIKDSAAAQQISESEAAQRLAANVSIGRLVTAAEVADVVTFLASPRSVAINGDVIAAGGGDRGAIHY
jgi:NAD(P)-dependent dehydrogenase (short-subunit alcohol dehydrogenase family)